MEPEGLAPWSQGPAAGPYLKWNESSSYFLPFFFM